MFIKTNIMNLFIMFCIGIYNLFVAGDDEVTYKAIFEGPFVSCEDYDNSFLDCSDLTLDSTSASDTCLQGSVSLTGEIVDQKIKLEVYKVGDMADELVFTVDGDVCENLKNPDAPWSAIFQNLNLTSCPIAIATYQCKRMVLDISFAQDYLCNEYCGSYSIRWQILKDVKPEEVIACYEVYVRVLEDTS